MHTLQRAIHDGQIPNELAKREESLAGISSALSLMCDIVMAWNGGPMQGDLRRIAPTGVEGINMRGTLDFPVEEYAERILPSSVVGGASPRKRSARTAAPP